MKKLVREGIILSIAFIVLFVVISFIISSSYKGFEDYYSFGFPLAIQEVGLQLCQLNENCSQFNSINIFLNLAIAIVLGFGTSYIKNSVIKK